MGILKKLFRRKPSTQTDQYMKNSNNIAELPSREKKNKETKKSKKKGKKNKGQSGNLSSTQSPPTAKASSESRQDEKPTQHTLSAPIHPDDMIRKPSFDVANNSHLGNFSTSTEDHGLNSYSADRKSMSQSYSNDRDSYLGSRETSSGSGSGSGTSGSYSQSYSNSNSRSQSQSGSSGEQDRPISQNDKKGSKHDKPAHGFSDSHFKADFPSFPEENNENIPNFNNSKSAPSGSQKGLNYTQVQKLEKRMANQPNKSTSPYPQAQPNTRTQLTRLPNGDLVPLSRLQDEVGSPMSASSEFALSTDDEDNDYNRIRRDTNLNMAPMLEQSPTSEEESSIGLNPIQNQIISPNHDMVRRNASYISNSESDTEEMDTPAADVNRSTHYFSDSDNGSKLSQPNSPAGLPNPSPKGERDSPAKKMPTGRFSFETEEKGDMKKSPSNDIVSLGSEKSLHTDMSPRTIAIQQAKKMSLHGKLPNKMYPDADFDADKKVFENESPQNHSKPTNKTGVIANFADFESNVFSNKNFDKSKSVAEPTSPVSELLAQAKARRNSRKGTSVNSAPVVNASFLRQHHNLPSKSNESPSNNRLANKIERTPSRGRGDDASAGASSAAKEKLIRRRRQKEAYLKSLNNDSDTESDKGTDANESWLIDEVTGALGPRGIAADLESLGEKSGISAGNKSHRSSRSRRSHKSSSRRKRSDESVGSRHSRHSRASRYSIKSAKSNMSEMSEQSRSVANDLLRLEMQLAMVGSRKAGSDAKREVQNSASGDTASASAKSQTIRQSRPSSALTKRVKVTVLAPAGKLGIILANKTDARGTIVSGVRTNSVLANRISPGDRIIAIDGEDVSRMTVSEITAIMARKHDFERVLSVLTTASESGLMEEAY